MPKKKEEKVEIINYYEKMPKKFLLQNERALNHFLEIFNGDGLFLQPHIQRHAAKPEEDGTSGAVGFEEEVFLV